MASASPSIEQAYRLVDQRRVAEAVAVLERAGGQGDAAALVELGAWHMGGQIVPRRLSRSREYFRQAGELGHDQARMIHIAFLANGTGGARDWRGALALLEATDSEDAGLQLSLIGAMDLTDDGDPRSVPERRDVALQPEVAWFDGLFTVQECDYLIGAAAPLLKPSIVVDPQTGQHVPHPVRTSHGASFPWAAEVPAIHALNRRLAAACGTDERAGEPLQILRYRPGQQYRPHHDALAPGENQRIITMLVYLNNDYAGGETVFTETELRLRGGIGDALVFRNADDDGRPDPLAHHAGEPVTSGEKLIASRWIHQQPFGPDRSI
jgi:prolyl 4-hydroxylase